MAKRCYALYQGDEFITLGTKKEIAKSIGKSVSEIFYYNSEPYISRNKDNGNRFILIEIEDEEE